MLICCSVYVGLPRWEQDGVNDSSLSILGMSYLEPTATSFVFSQQAIVHNNNLFKPTLSAFNASVYLVDSNGTVAANPLTVLPISSIHALNGQGVNITSADITISNLDAVTNYAIAVISQKNVTNRLVGHTNVHLGSLPVNNVQYDQDVTYPGMNGLDGFNVTSIILNLTTPAGEPNMKGTAVVPNASLLTVAMVCRISRAPRYQTH